MQQMISVLKQVLAKPTAASLAYTQPWGLLASMSEDELQDRTAMACHQEEVRWAVEILSEILDKAIPPHAEPPAYNEHCALLSLLAAAAAQEVTTYSPILAKASANAVDRVLHVVGKGGKDILRRSGARRDILQRDGTSKAVALAETCALGELAVRLCRAFNGAMEGIKVLQDTLTDTHQKTLTGTFQQEDAARLCEVYSHLAWHPEVSGHTEVPTPLITIHIAGQPALLIPLSRLHDMIIAALGEHSLPRFYGYMPYYMDTLRTVAFVAEASIGLAMPAYVPGKITAVTAVGYTNRSQVTGDSSFGGVSTYENTEEFPDDTPAISMLTAKVRNFTRSLVPSDKAMPLPPHVWWLIPENANRVSVAELRGAARRVLGFDE
jgi:hypothetical protein